jgi:RNA-directed DNA polymerase
MAESEDDKKKELYRRLVQSANPHVVAARMKELGFWPAKEPLPDESPAARAERLKVEAELERLRQQHAAVKDPEKALAAERKRRWEESKKRRAEKKLARAAAKKARAEQWAKEEQTRIGFLGEGVSGGLDAVDALEADDFKLQKLGLPLLKTGPALAAALGLDLKTLKWLTYHRRGATLVHYHRYGIPKKTGGIRPISAPKPKLAAAQEWVLRNVLDKVAPTAEAHGFVRARSVVTNATPHVGKKVVVNLDVKDFFPTFRFRRVKGLFRKGLGFSEHVATVLALLCTEPPRVEVSLDGKAYMVALGERVLPQGACTSPAITNLICTRLDRRLAGLARYFGYRYTRYADDLTFSGDDTETTGKLLAGIRRVVKAEGLEPNEDKTRVMRPGRRQEVTGVTVNQKLSVARDEVRKLKAILHNCATKGLASQNRENHPDFAAHLRGKVAWVSMVDPARGAKLAALLTKALERG